MSLLSTASSSSNVGMYTAVLCLLFPLVFVYAKYEAPFADSPSALSHSDFERGNALVRHPVVDDATSYDPNLIEGDIIPPVQTTKLQGSGPQRNAIKLENYRWPNNRMPYELDTVNQFSEEAKTAIASAMQEIMNKTCIKYVPKQNNDTDYLVMKNRGWCSSFPGKQGGAQPVKIGGCATQAGKVVHELMHALGFFHEQSRNDRDEWVEIKFENMEKGDEDQFQKQPLYIIDHLGTPYDYGSVLHYSEFAFSKNDEPTIVAKHQIPLGVQMGQRIGLSENDARKINILYNCPDVPAPSTTAPEVVEVSTEATTPDINPECKDNDERCSENKDLCDGYGDHTSNTMRKLCPFTCGACESIATTETPITDVKCEEGTELCKIYKRLDLCGVIPRIAKEECPLTCRVEDDFCPTAYQLGICDDYIKECPFTCGVCR